MRSFNLGVPSMFLPESLYVIDCVLAQRSTRLHWMFIELDEPKLRAEEHAGLVHREVYWHGLRETALMSVDVLTAPGIHRRERLAMLAHQWALFARRWARVGVAQEWLTEDAATVETGTLGPRENGYRPYRTTLGEERGSSKDMRGELRSFTAAAAALKAGRGKEMARSEAPALLRWLLTEKIRALRAQNVEPVFVIAPVTTGEELFLRMAREGVGRPLFAFNDPAAYPQLYEANMRADTMHLNAAGSVRFTRLLAERFADYRAAPAPAPER